VLEPGNSAPTQLVTLTHFIYIIIDLDQIKDDLIDDAIICNCSMLHCGYLEDSIKTIKSSLSESFGVGN